MKSVGLAAEAAVSPCAGVQISLSLRDQEVVSNQKLSAVSISQDEPLMGLSHSTWLLRGKQPLL